MDVMRAGARATRHGHFPIAGTLLVFCIAIDVIEVFGSYYKPDVVGHWACAMRPLGAISRPLFSYRWLAFVDSRCAGDPFEPTASILFFMAKIVAGLAAVVGGWLALGLQRQWYIEERKAAFEELENGVLAHFRQLTPVVLLGALILGILGGLWNFGIQQVSPADFDITFIHKLLFEDAFVFLLLTLMALILPACFLSFVIWPGQYWLFRGKERATTKRENAESQDP